MMKHSEIISYLYLHVPLSCDSWDGYEEKSLQAQIPLQEKASRKIPPEENSSQQNASTLKSLPAKHL